ncbi:MAG: cation transporter [Armatimonadota bacterium]
MGSARETDITRRKRLAAGVSVLSNVLLTVSKFAAFLLSGSVSALTEALHSVGDIVASVLSYAGVRVGDAPADQEHPYGHGKVESFAGLAEALLLVGAGLYVGYVAIARMLNPQPILVDVALAIISAAAVWNLFVSRYIQRVAEQTDSEALRANAFHLTADVYTSVGVLAALLLVRFTGNPIFDPLIALALTAWILVSGGRIALRTYQTLIDMRLPQHEVDAIIEVLRRHPAVLGYHQLRTRKAGSQRHVDAHILVEDALSLVDAHAITEEVEDLIRAELPNVVISLHTEPYRQEAAHRKHEHGDQIDTTCSDR